MMRPVIGVVAATVAAPFLVAFFLNLAALFSGDSPGIKEPLDLLKSIPLGIAGLAIFGIPVLLLASLLAWVLHAWGSRSRGAFIAAASGLGAVFFGCVLFDRATPLSEQVTEIVSGMGTGALSGAICGWIYWRIAVRGRTLPQAESS